VLSRHSCLGGEGAAVVTEIKNSRYQGRAGHLLCCPRVAAVALKLCTGRTIIIIVIGGGGSCVQ
jgi:hypothetical protein